MIRRVICVDATGWPESLTQGQIYEVLDPIPGDEHVPDMIRIVDDSGEDYLHEGALFRELDEETN